MIKDRPHRLDLLYIDQPLYFVTFATRDRKNISSLDRAQFAREQYARCGMTDINVALGRYVIMPDHVHLFVRGDRSFTLSSWIGGLKRAMSVALKSSRLWQPGFLITFCVAMKAMRRNGITSGQSGSSWSCEKRGQLAISRGDRRDRSRVTVEAAVSAATIQNSQATRLPLQGMHVGDTLAATEIFHVGKSATSLGSLSRDRLCLRKIP